MKLHTIVTKIWSIVSPISFLKFRYRYLLKRKLNLNNPRDLNEKIIWMMLYSDTSEWTKLADKYAVRKYLKECGLEHILVKLYGVWDNVDDINFDELPDSFVLKTNHGCGDIIIVEDKHRMDIHAIKAKLKSAQNHRHGKSTCEWHYLKIKPLIIAEELLLPSDNDKKISSSIIDYKFYCLDGKPHSILVCSNRMKGHTDASLYDANWNSLSNHFIPNPHFSLTKLPIPKPAILDECCKIAESLAKPFPFVRVDLYIINNRPYFGELTFTSTGGITGFLTQSLLLDMGKQITLPAPKIG